MRTLVREPEWFRGVSSAEYGWTDRPPEPYLAAIQLERDGLLWTFVAVPAATWKEAWPQLGPNQKEVDASLVAMDKLFDTMVEVIDPGKGVVVARAQLPGIPLASLSGQRLATYRVAADGATSITIQTLKIDR